MSLLSRLKMPASRYVILMKNMTPRQLALLTAVSVGFVAFIGLLLFNVVLNVPIALKWALLLSIGNTIVCYFLFYYALERFIYRRIKLVYKNIHRLKKSPSIAPGKIDMSANIITDVETQVKEWTEEQKQEIEELKKMEVYRREFLGNVSHELKTPIFNLQGYLYTLLDGGINDAKINIPYLKKAAKNADRLSGIVNDLEEIARHETGQLQLSWDTFNIYTLAQEVMESLDMTAASNGVQLDFKPGIDTSIIVYADREKIGQVFTNLIANALKYGKEGSETLVGIYKMHENVLVEVSDTGIGIAEVHLPRLFERFYRVDVSRSRAKGGSGLGLSIVKHIMEAHHQTIHVRSKPGIGTTFGFTLAISK